MSWKSVRLNQHPVCRYKGVGVNEFQNCANIHYGCHLVVDGGGRTEASFFFLGKMRVVKVGRRRSRGEEEQEKSKGQKGRTLAMYKLSVSVSAKLHLYKIQPR